MIAVLTSDLHLSEKPPLARSGEEDWLAVQRGYLNQLRDIKASYNVPLVVAGDIFDTWKSSPRLINFAIRHLPECFAVPGQHDLPFHKLDDIEGSAYWTLVEANIIRHLQPGTPVPTQGLVLHGFPYGVEVTPCPSSQPLVGIHLAVIHAMIWTKKTAHEGVKEESGINQWRPRLKGYQAAVFGDNHKPFLSHKEDQCTILNCGSFLRRRSNEIDHAPAVGLLHLDGSITLQPLDTSGDKFSITSKPEISSDFEELIHDLNELETSTLDFLDELQHCLDTSQASERVRALITKLIEQRKVP